MRLMIRLSCLACVLGLLLGTQGLAAASPVDPALPLVVDGATVGHYVFDGDPAAGFADRSGAGEPATVLEAMPNVHVEPAPAQLAEHFSRVLNVRDGALQLPDVMARVADGPFTVEWRARLRRGAEGLLVQQDAHHALSIRYYDRDGGRLDVTCGFVDSNGERKRASQRLTGVLERHGPWSVERFYHVALTFDGDHTFELFLDGHPVTTFVVPESGALTPAGRHLILGNNGKYRQSAFEWIAEVRVSNVVRTFTPVPRRSVSTLADAIGSGAVKLDMTTESSPLAEGSLRVLPDTVYDAQRGFGWAEPAHSAFDSWFTGSGYKYTPETVEAAGERHVADWDLRDGHQIVDGATFRVNLPPGRYEVVVHVGHPWENKIVDRVEANGQVIGRDLMTFAFTWRQWPVDRSARGVVDVGDDGLRVQFFSDGSRHSVQMPYTRNVNSSGDTPMGVLAIEAYPYAPPVVRRESGRLVGGDAAALEPVNQAIAAGDLQAALVHASEISDTLTRCTVLAWIAGYPVSTDLWQEQVVQRVLFELDHLLTREPGNVAAASLRRSVRYLEDVLSAANRSGLTDRISPGPANRSGFEAADQALQLTREDPVWGQAMFAAGTMLFWAAREGGFTEPRFPEFEVTSMRKLHEVYPEARLPRIYLGEKLPNAKQIHVPTDAPQWASLFHRLLTRVVDVHAWWVNVKQDERGLLGGGFGDDVEATRSWPVSILIADREDVREGWRKLAEYAWADNPGVYRKQMMDIEHGSEDFADSHMFPVFFEYGTPRHELMMQRTAQSWTLFRDMWSHKDAQGFRTFRSAYMSLTEVDERRPGNSAYGLRMLAPAMYNLYFSRDPEATQLLVEYADNWLEAALAERDGKPAGIVPVWIGPDRSIGHSRGQWWTGLIGISYPIPIYYVYDLFIAAYDLTGDAKYLEPMWQGMKLLGDNPRPAVEDGAPLPEGSLLWALYGPHAKYDDFFGAAFIGAAASTARRLSGERGFDDLLLAHGPPVARAVIGLERGVDDAMGPLIDQLETDLSEMDFNIEMHTTEVRRTDRIYLKGIDTLMGMATSDTGTRGRTNSVWPTYAVSWRNTGADVSMFVTRAQPRGVEAMLYSFAPQDKTIAAQFWRLEPGKYTVTLRDAAGKSISSTLFEYTRLGDAVELTLPPGVELTLTIEPEAGVAR